MLNKIVTRTIIFT